jgi:hypothetical protein
VTGTDTGEGVMKLLDSGIRVFILAQGAGTRWLKEELNSLKVTIPLTEGCLEELVRQADSVAQRTVGAARGEVSYLTDLRQELAAQARLVQRWTTSDEKLGTGDENAEAFVRIARKYALPRPWKLSDPVAVESRRLRPAYWKWGSGLEGRPVPQS